VKSQSDVKVGNEFTGKENETDGDSNKMQVKVLYTLG